MSTATRVPYEQYVAIIEAGGKAFAFYVPEGDDNETEDVLHATRVLNSGKHDWTPDRERHDQRCYTLTE